MATHDYVIANGTGAAVRSDLNGALAAIVSQNSSATEPSPSYAYQRWADTTAGVMKMRNGANNAWITLYQLDGEWSTIAFENGTAAAPSIYFKDSGTDTGIYSPGADQVAISTGGTSRLAVTTTAVSSTLAVDVPLGAVGTPSITFTGDLNTGVFSPGADTLALVTGGTEALRIISSGRHEIGSTQQAILCGVTSAAGTATAVLVAKHSITQSNVSVTGTDALIIWSNGNVINLNNSYGSISDIKLKENIVDANSQWDDLKALKVRNYNLKEGQTHTQIGLVAQEAELVSPGLVNESPDRDEEGNDLGTVTKSINYSVLYMKAVKALQEAMERIETLEASNADLLARVSALEAAVS